MALVRVRYKGLSDVRAISVKDAEEAGVKLSEDLVWDNQGGAYGAPISGIKRPKQPNNHKGILIEMSDELEQLLRREGTFTITEVDKDTMQDKDENIVTGSAVDDTGDTVIDATTGQKSKKR